MTAENQYLKSQVENASPLGLIVLLYDGALKFLNQAKEFLKAEKFEDCAQKTIRARNIIQELMGCLNEKEGGDISKNLMALYIYVYEQLVYVNIYKDAKYIDESVKILGELRESWAAIAEKKEVVKTLDTQVEAPESDPQTEPVAQKAPSAPGIDFSG